LWRELEGMGVGKGGWLGEVWVSASRGRRAMANRRRKEMAGSALNKTDLLTDREPG
jgi:hypothetical protein